MSRLLFFWGGGPSALGPRRAMDAEPHADGGKQEH